MLTTIGLLLSYLRYQKKGSRRACAASGWSLLPFALALTGTLEAGRARSLDDVGRWAVAPRVQPVVWLGIALAGCLGGAVRRLRLPRPPRRRSGQAGCDRARPAGQAGKRRGEPVDDDMADIEAILRKHGIQ